MSLKEKLKGSWQGVKKDWKEEGERKKVLVHKEREAYQSEKLKQAELIGKARAKAETKNRLKVMRTPRSMGMQVNPLFSGGLFGEPMGIRRKSSHKKSSHKKRSGALYIDGHKIESKPTNRKRIVHRRKRQNPFGFGEGLY